eukprot:6456691-Amphidinium_carterae.1
MDAQYEVDGIIRSNQIALCRLPQRNNRIIVRIHLPMDEPIELHSHLAGAPPDENWISSIARWHGVKHLPTAPQLSKGQIKLLLKGDLQLQKRVIQARTDEQAADLFKSAATRYGITFKDSAHPAPPQEAWNKSWYESRPNSDGRGRSMPASTTAHDHSNTGANNNDWQEVRRRRANTRSPSRKQQTDIRKDGRPETSDLELQLLQEDWNVSVLHTLKLGCSGVLLTTTQDEAQLLQHNLRGAQAAIALITLSPLANAKRSTQVTFRATATRGKAVTERILSGYLNQYGQSDVQHLFTVPQLEAAPPTQRTTVLYAEVSRNMIWYSEWNQLVSIKTTADFNQFVGQMAGLEVSDVWRVKIESDRLSLLMRIPTTDTTSWLLASIPLILAPVGQQGLGYQVIWDRDIKYVEEARQRFDGLPGYKGLATSRGGLGARIEEASHQQALSILGRAVGEVWTLTGFPLDSVEADAQHLLTSLAWNATLMTGSRRVRGRAASYRVRSMEAPRTVALRMAIGQEVCQIHLSRNTSTKQVGEQARQRESQTPQTWAQVARQSIGVMQSSENPFAATAWKSPPPNQQQQQAWSADSWNYGAWHTYDDEAYQHHQGWQDQHTAQWPGWTPKADSALLVSDPLQHVNKSPPDGNDNDEEMKFQHHEWMCIADLMGEQLLEMDPQAGYGKVTRALDSQRHTPYAEPAVPEGVAVSQPTLPLPRLLQIASRFSLLLSLSLQQLRVPRRTNTHLLLLRWISRKRTPPMPGWTSLNATFLRCGLCWRFSCVSSQVLHHRHFWIDKPAPPRQLSLLRRGASIHLILTRILPCSQAQQPQP